ncbi:hypothetical protein FRP1_16505 [Pseudonocardia sp. EC080625-04]|uniref:GAF and ANTAR domain-containing protein n=1 Tax=unclassified Pseudonocardia TaxID=2619320 RepID=UPI0006CB18E6|nr:MULTISPECIES: GAF and ANTAR domain-containing protein [unclassified Pseudonocardia]ALE74209.1 hypothetical protein FRP1_16505 [Pseudonocardia sp. EC080625-04]
MDTHQPPGSHEPLQAVLDRIATQLTSGVSRQCGPRSRVLLEHLTAAAVATIPGADYAGLTVHDHDGLSSRAPSHPDITQLDQLQVTLGEGPCVEAVAPGTAARVVVDDFRDERRWPRFATAAAERGVRSLLSHRTAPHDGTRAALNLYSVTPRGFDEESREIAGVFASHAAVALYGATDIANLERALATRDLIGQAKGVLMQTYQLDADQAFSLLTRYSQHTNSKLHDVARRITESAVHPRR